MKRAVVLLVVLALCAAPALAGQNPDIALYLYSTNTGVGGTNHAVLAGVGYVYVCLDTFGPGGGMQGANFRIQEVGPAVLATTNLFAGVGGLTLGTVNVAPGVSMTTGPVAYPSANGVVVLASLLYAGAGPGSITLMSYGNPPNVPLNRNVSDANFQYDQWCVHSLVRPGLSGNWGWDPTVPPDGDCQPISPVEDATWGSIKALYR
jgi:hypothetical protein